MIASDKWKLAIAIGLLVGQGSGPGAALAQEIEANKVPAADAVLRDYRSATGLLNKGLHELAIPEYQRFLAEQPTHEKAGLARYGLAVCYFRLNRFEEAGVALSAIPDSAEFPFRAEVLAMRGQISLLAGEFDPAAKCLGQVVRECGASAAAPSAGALWVEALQRAGQSRDALAAAEICSKRWPEDPSAERVGYYAAVAQRSLGQWANAVTTLEQLLGRYPAGPLSRQARLLLADSLEQLQDWPRAAAEYDKLGSDEGAPLTAEARLGLARTRLAQGDAAGAEKIAAEMGRAGRSAQSATIGLILARAQIAQGNYSGAIAVLGRLPIDDLDLADDIAYWTAKCHLRSGATDAAAQRLAEAIEQFPQSELRAEMGFDCALALQRMGKLDEALTALQPVRESSAGTPLAADAVLLSASIAHQRGDYDTSAGLCADFLKANPLHTSQAQAAFLLAENYFLAGRHEEAVAAFARFAGDHANDSQVAKARFRMGLAFAKLGRWEEAMPLLKEAAGAAEKDAALRVVWLVLGERSFELEQWADAARLLGRYGQADPAPEGLPAILLKFGIAAGRAGDRAVALAALERVTGAPADGALRAHAWFERGELMLAGGDESGAAAAFAETLKLAADSPFTPYAHQRLADLATRRGKPEEALAHLNAIGLAAGQDPTLASETNWQTGQTLLKLERYAEARAVLLTLCEKYPSSKRIPAARAQAAICLARLDEREAAVAELAALDAQMLASLDGELRGAVHYEHALGLRGLGRTSDAATVFQKLVESAGDGPLGQAARVELAALEMEQRRFAPAAELLRAVRGGPGFATLSLGLRNQTAYRLGVCEFEVGRFAPAVAALEEFLRESDDPALALSANFYCGESLLKLDDPERAATSFTRVTEQAGRDASYAAAWLRLGDALAQRQRWPASEQAFSDFLDRFADHPNRYQAQFGLGWARENQGRHSEAIAVYQAVVESHSGPTAARAQFQIGECLFAQKKLDDAVRELLKVDILYAYPEWSAAALFEAGRCLEELGKSAEARQQYEAVIAKHGDTRWANLARERQAVLQTPVVPGRK